MVALFQGGIIKPPAAVIIKLKLMYRGGYDMGIFGCDYLETRGTLFPSYYCKHSRQELTKNTAHDICMTNRYTDCADYKNASRCFVTTAVCLTMGKPDDCEELTVMRKFRDDWLRHRPGGAEQIEEYYKIAPGIVKKIDAESNRKAIYEGIYWEYIVPCVDNAEKGNYSVTRRVYTDMLDRLKHQYV